MSWNIACFCGHLIHTSTCPHCGSTLTDLSVRPALRRWMPRGRLRPWSAIESVRSRAERLPDGLADIHRRVDPGVAG